MDPVEKPVEVPSPGRVPPPGVKPGQERDPITGRLVKKRIELGTERVSDVEAMEYVVSHARDLTNQHVYFRRLMEKEPKWFAERLAGLQAARAEENRSGETGDSPGPEWDGVGPCPVCGHDAAEGEAEPVEKLIEELLTGGVGDA